MSRVVLRHPRQDVGPNGPDRADLHRRLLRWYRRNGRRLPWRGIRDPYRIWISEVMLQQTRLATALPYYQKFIERFPTTAKLSSAKEADVLAAWSGLGYYRRARNLHAAARLVVREYGGCIPDDPDRFGSLPGIGRYTSGAVLSIAFDRPLPALDGNVARVLSRLYALDAAVRDPRGARALWDLAATLVPPRSPGDWNQSLMELGALVCVPRKPDCGRCPLRSVCRAYALGRIADFPPVIARRRAQLVRVAMVVISRRGRLLMARRERDPMLGLWEPPSVEVAAGSAGTQLGRELRRLGIRARLATARQGFSHLLSHREFRVRLWRGELIAVPPRSRRLRWIDPRRPRVALTGVARKAARTSLPARSDGGIVTGT